MDRFFSNQLNKENASSRNARSLREIKPVDKPPTDKQSTDQPPPPAQSDNTFMARFRKSAEKMLAYPQRVIAMANRRTEIQEQSRQVRILLNACKDHYRELGNQKNLHVPPTGDQEKFLEAFKNADEYKNKAKDILNQVAMDPNELGHFIDNFQKVNQELKKSKLVKDAVLDTSVKTDKSSGKITIDLAKFVSSAIDLSKLNLSDPDKIEVTDTSPDKERKYQFELFDHYSSDWGHLNFILNNQQNIKGTLKSGYELGTYKTHPELYASVLESHLKAQLYSKLRKTDLQHVEFIQFKQKFLERTEDLIKVNNLTLEKNELKSFFFDDPTERKFAEEKCILNAYQTIIPELKAPTEQHNDFETLRQINHSLREIAQNYPEQFRPALKQAIATTRTLHHWATNFQDRFDLDEEWVQAGMKKLGITKDIFEASFTEFLTNPLLTQEIHSGPAVSDIVDGNPDTRRPAYNANQIVEHFEDFTRLNASLKYVNDRLKGGIPTKNIPDSINGRKTICVSGTGNDCLPRSLLKGAHPEWPNEFIEKQVQNVRDHVLEKHKNRAEEYKKVLKDHQDKIQNSQGKIGLEDLGPEHQLSQEHIYDIENAEVQRWDQLNLGGDAGQLLIDYLRSEEAMVTDPITREKVHLLDPERGVLAYQHSNGKIQCIEQTEGSANKLPYAILRDHYSDYKGIQTGHYWAILDKSSKTT